MSIINPMYNNPYGNQMYMGNQYQMPQNQPAQVNNVIVGIQGFDAVKAYPLGPNTRGYFFDTEDDFIYIKENDANGFPKGPVTILRCHKITEEELRNPIKTNIPQDVVTYSGLDAYIQQYLDSHSYKPFIPKRKEQKDE